MPHTRSPFHAGEIRVQERAGVRAIARRREGIIHDTIAPRVRAFLEDRRMLIVGTVDDRGRPWASLLPGAAGFVRVPEPSTMWIGARPVPGDPMEDTLREGVHVGLLAVDLERRMRVRVNGRLGLGNDGAFRVHTEQVYPNCPKYIQSRRPLPADASTSTPTSRHSHALDDRQRAWIRGADTFFIATANPGEGVDASHRGGRPGFLQVDGNRLAWPDYAGNAMFCTLGNIAVHPRAGLLFVDFAAGTLLQLSGQAAIDWDPDRAADVPGAERMVVLDVERVVEIAHSTSLRWTLAEHSPFNP